MMYYGIPVMNAQRGPRLRHWQKKFRAAVMSDHPFGRTSAKVISRPLGRRKTDKTKVSLHESNEGFEVKVLNTTQFATRPVGGEKQCGFVSMKTFNVIMCGVIFALLFAAFTPTQNLQSTLNETTGNYALGILYISLALSSIVSPLIVMKIGEKWAMMLGGTTYIAWFAAQIVVVPGVLVGLSGLNGFGAAILWIAQGVFLTKNSTKETLGRNSGIFFGFFQLNQVIGNLIAAAILSHSHNSTQNPAQLFILFTVTSACSVLLFFVLQSAPKEQTMVEPPLYNVNVMTRIVDIWRVLKDRNFLLLVLIIAYSGFSQSFFSGSFTKELGRFLLNYVMIFFGVADALGSFMFGKVIDVLGRKPILILATAMVMIATILLLSIHREVLQERTMLYYIFAIMFGLGDAGVFTVLYATVGNLFASRVETAFGTFRLVQSLTTGITFVVFLYVEDFALQILMLDTLLLAGLLGFLILDFFFANVDSQADVKEQPVR